MALKIIKKGSMKTAGVQPFAYAEDSAEAAPQATLWGEVPLEDEFPPEPEPESLKTEEASAAPEPAVDVAQVEREAFERGFVEGQRELEESAQKRIDEAMERYAAALVEVSGLKSVLRAQVEDEVVRLAVAVAKKIVHREISLDATIIQTLVRVALERVSGNTSVTVRLNPKDYEYMLSRREELAQAEGRDVAFASDSAITQGGCLIQTESGDIDARIEEEFAEVEGAFFKGQ